MKLSQIKNEWQKYIVIKDKYILDIILATLIGNSLVDRDPIWTMIVAPSSGGKTTLIAPCGGIPSVFFIDDLTEKTLLSGYKIKGKSSSLLQMIGSGIMAFSDFTNILSKNTVSRGEILSQLKLVYDRKVTKYTGTGGVEWQGKIGFIGCATPDIYHYLESGRSMGERFIYYWLEQPTDDEIAEKQAEVSVSAKEITDRMKEFYGKYVHEIGEWVRKKGVPPLNMNAEQRERVRRAAIFCVNGKATVHTNFKSGKADQIPNKAGVGRDNKAFDALLQTLQLMHCYELNEWDAPVQDWMIELVEKCAYSSINRERRKILEILVASKDPMTASEIGAKNGLGLDKEAVEMYLIPLHAVGLVRKQVQGRSFKWFIEDKLTISFVQKICNFVREVPLKEGDDEISEEDQLADKEFEDF
jgi:DNA-binding transcriptional ArsR family regulator